MHAATTMATCTTPWRCSLWDALSSRAQGARRVRLEFRRRLGHKKERGDQGPPGAGSNAGKIVLWVDATGAVVGPEPVVIDGAVVEAHSHTRVGSSGLMQQCSLSESRDCRRAVTAAHHR